VRSRIRVLEHEPSARSERTDHGLQRSGAVLEVDQHQPGVDQVERLGRRRVADHVVAAHLYGAACRGLAPRHVDVGGQHSSPRPHALGQAAQYRDAARAHLPAPPPFPEPEIVEVPESPRVEQFGERREPFARLPAAVVKQVPVHSSIMARPVRCGYER
jgi:hypothetical protein